MSSPKAGSKTTSGRLAIIADVHLGPRGVSVGQVWEQGVVADRMLATFREVFYWMEENHCRTVIVAGDFFDRRVISPRVVGELQALFEQYSASGYHMYVMSGNHDVDVHSGNALDYLPDIYVHKVTGPGVVGHIDDMSNMLPSTSVLFAPYVCGMSAVDSIKAATKSLDAWPGNPPRVLVGHFGVYSDGAPSWEEADPLSLHISDLEKLLRGAGIEVVACGHYHNAAEFQLKNLTVFQVGSLSPRNFGENGARFGSVLELWGTAEGPVEATHHIGAVSGVRYVVSCGQLQKPWTEGVDLDTLRRCWFVLKQKIDPFPIRTKVVQNPKSVDDIVGGAVTIANYHKPSQRYKDEQIGPMGLSPQHAIAYHCKTLRWKGELEGPAFGLLEEALSRTHGDPVVASVTAPPLPVSLELERRR